MYTGSIKIYLSGLDATAVTAIECIKAPEPFTLNVVATDGFGCENVVGADFVIAESTVLTDDIFQYLASAKEANKGIPNVIAICTNGVPDDSVCRNIELLTDIWPTGMSADLLQWRMSLQLQNFKEKTDAGETSQFLEATINSIPCLVWYKTKDGIHEKVNDAFCQTVGKAKEDVQGKGHAYIWDVETDDPACIESENKVMTTQQTCVAEETVQTGDGTRLLTTYKSPLYNPDGTVMGTVGVAIDITQEKAYERDLLQKNQTLETIFRSLDCGVLTHSADGSRIIGVNNAALQILGYKSEDDMVAHGFDMVAESVFPEDKERLRQDLESLVNVGDSISTRYRIRHEDGKILHVMGNAKLIEKDGELLYQRFLLDYSDQKREEERRERRHQALIRALSENYLAVSSYDLDTGEGELLRISDEADDELRGIFEKELNFEESRDEYIEKRVYEDDKRYLRNALSRESVLAELSDKKRFNVMYRSFVNDAVGYRQATVVKAGVWGDDPEGRFFVLGLRDVDQETREEMQQKELLEAALHHANRANEAKSAFLSNMSHDIRTPMNAIVGFTTLANNHIDQTERVKEYLGKIQTSSAHLLGLINDILDMSRIESGKVSLEEAPCDLDELLEKLQSILHNEISQKHLNFTVDVAGVDSANVVCDELKLNQILLNLLGNAIKFTADNGKISVVLRQSESSIHGRANYSFVISDNGIGMEEEFIEHIFDPFERERTSTISGIQGTGLGMAITKSLVDMMGGTIQVKSKKGEGSEFTVTLPFVVMDDADIKQAEHSFDGLSRQVERLRGCRILLVDDNMLNREIAATLLEDAGFQVEHAVDGQDAIDKLSASEDGYFQLVLMDIQMPVMNGYEAATTIRAMDNSYVSKLPILAVTADAFDEDRQKALECGMNGHIAKPIKIEALFETLDSML